MAKTLALLLMDPPYESANSTTALRIIDAAINQGHHVRVFAFEGAVALTMQGQEAHPNPVHGTDCEAENHPLPRAFVAALFEQAKAKGVEFEWVNCGFCVDERGAGDWIAGPRRGGPPDFKKMLDESDTTLVIPTK